MIGKVDKLFMQHLDTINNVREVSKKTIQEFANKCINTLKNGGCIFFIGNGGSAADSQHLAAELVGRFQKDRKGYAAVALTTDTSILTSISNDYGYDKIFARQIEALVNENDLVVGISTSGNSENIIQGILEAKNIGADTVGLLGKDGGCLKELCDLSIIVPSSVTARVQEAHILIGHIVCEIVEEVLMND